MGNPVDTLQNPVLPLSVIEIPVRLHRLQLQEDLNTQLGDTLYADAAADGDNLEIRALKASDIQLVLSGQEILYNAPLDLWVRKKMRLATLEGTGALTLHFKTRYQIREDWTLETFTELVDYTWEKKPVLKTALIDIPLKLVADLVIKNSRQKLTAVIDEQVKANLDLRKEVDSAWKMLHEPFLLSEEYATWMLMQPKALYMAPFQTRADTVESVIGLQSELHIVMGQEPLSAAPIPLPPLQWQMNGQRRGFSLMLQADIPFLEAERMAKESIVGQKFTQGKKRYVVVEDMKLFRQGNQLAVETLLSGSYNGAVNLLGTPRYSAERRKIELEDLDVELQTRNILHKTLGWLFKGVFKNQIRKSLDEYLNYYLESTQKSLQEEMNHVEIAPGIFLQGNLSRLNVDQLYLTMDAMRLWIGMQGEMEVDIEGLGF